jgi:hypothetical protein
VDASYVVAFRVVAFRSTAGFWPRKPVRFGFRTGDAPFNQFQERANGCTHLIRFRATGGINNHPTGDSTFANISATNLSAIALGLSLPRRTRLDRRAL